MLNTSKNDVPLYSQVKKECFTHEKTSRLLCQREPYHTTSIANHTALRNRKKEKFALEMMTTMKGKEENEQQQKMRGRRRSRSGCVESI